VEILATMQSQSAPLTSIGNNGKPTVIDFWWVLCWYNLPSLLNDLEPDTWLMGPYTIMQGTMVWKLQSSSANSQIYRRRIWQPCELYHGQRGWW
jgi:hypothetical protein